jgi:hypothetical protein
LVLANDLAERRVRRDNSESEKAQCGFKQDCAGHDERRVDDDDTDRIRQDVTEDDPAVARSRDPRGIDKLTLTQTQELTSHQSGKAGPDEETQHDSQHRGTKVSEGATDHRSDDDDRDGDDDVGEAHEDRVGDPAIKAGDRADDCANATSDDADDHHDHE